MAKKKYVLISLVTRKKMNQEPYGRKILSLFYDHYSELAPQYANFYEPINKPVNTVEGALAFWEDEMFLCRRRNLVAGWWHVSEDISKVGRIKFEYDWNKKVDWFKLFYDLVMISEAYFGYVHVFTEREIEPAAIGSSISAFQMGAAGFHLKKGIPQLGWAHYFGEEYVKEIDVPLLQKHGFDVQKFGEGYVFHITDKLSDVIDNYEHFDERRKLLKSLFRPTLFQKYAKYEHES
ncbi:MAG: hypothetical protein H0X26_09310 [Alphaproteobacteria bacterium]|nr:hypothetical protein [Alphaproteobacteria bacterium]